MDKEKARELLKNAYDAYVESRATGMNREASTAALENFLRLKCVLPVVAGLNRSDIDSIQLSSEESFMAHFEAVN